jgi:lycopene beta-cyclase
MSQTYSAITSERLHHVVSRRIAGAPNAQVVTGTALHVECDSVLVAGGEDVVAKLVVDARGPESGRVDAQHFQKFVGVELQIEPGTGPEVPVLMDASVQQVDGFRFVYLLPFGNDRVLVEDTYYSDTPHLDVERLAQGMVTYARRRGMNVRGIARQEQGVLPLPTKLPPMTESASPLVGGYAGGFFHPTTGYSLPAALRLAEHIASRRPEDVFDSAYENMLRAHRRQFRYCCLLNRLLFGAFAQDQRYNVLERFYRLPSETIRRFYAMEMNVADRARILCGRPPRGFSLRHLLTEGNYV